MTSFSSQDFEAFDSCLARVNEIQDVGLRAFVLKVAAMAEAQEYDKK